MNHYTEIQTATKEPKFQDRFTIVTQAHFQEWETHTAATVQWSYERFSDSKESCQQFNLRINPGTKTKLPVQGEKPLEMLLGHKSPAMGAVDPMFKEQQEKNVIEIWDDEKLLGWIGSDRMMFGQFKGSLYAVSTTATAILHITAFPL
jgi:hypothetical protein